MPPSIWPSQSAGLIARPTSWAAVTFEQPDRAERGVDGELHHLRAPAVDRVGDALAVGVERRGRRVPGLLGGEDVAMARRAAASPRSMARAPPTSMRGRSSASGASGPALAWRRIAARSARPARLGGAAGDGGLARGRGLAGVGRQRGVGADQGEGGERHAEGVGGDLGDDGVRALADVDRALVQHDGAVGADADADRRGVGQRGVAAAVPAGGDPDAAAERPGDGVGPGGCGERAGPGRPQRLEALDDAGRGEHLAGGGGVAVAEGVPAGGTRAGRCRRPRRGGRSASRWRGRPAARRSRGRRRRSGCGCGRRGRGPATCGTR